MKFIIILSILKRGDFMALISKTYKDTIHKCRKVVDVIRKNSKVDKNTIVNESKLSWSTVNSYLEELIAQGIILQKDNLYYVNKSTAYIAGISFEVTEIKVTLVDFTFKKDDISLDFCKKLKEKLPQKQNVVINEKDKYICINTPQNYLDSSDLCTKIISELLDFFKYEKRLFSIGMSLPGIMDGKTHDMKFSPNLQWLNGLDVYLLISKSLIKQIKDNGSEFGIYHDMDAVSVFEIENLINSPKEEYKDILCLFMSYGIASSLVKNKSLRLFRSSEHGHIMTSIGTVEPPVSENKCAFSDNPSHDKDKIIKPETKICSCGQDCFENQIRRNIFESETIKDFYNKAKSENFLLLDEKRYSLMCKYLGFLFNHIINTMRVDKIILSGRILNGISGLKDDIDRLKIGNTISALSNNCVIVNGHSDLDIAAIGAAIISYYHASSKQEPNDLIITW